MSDFDPQHLSGASPDQPSVDREQVGPQAEPVRTSPQTQGPSQIQPQGQSLPPQSQGHVASSAPIGVARPVPVQTGTMAVHPDRQDEAMEDEGDLAEVAFKVAPPWLISALVHIVILIVLAYVLLPPLVSDQISLTSEPERWAEDLGKQLKHDSMLTGVEFEEDAMPVLTPEDLIPVEDPLATSKDLEKVLDGLLASSDLKAARISISFSGRTPGFKESMLGPHGGTKITQEAVERGLEWLAKQQRSDGHWSLIGPYPNGAFEENEPAATAMALLAFQATGITHKKGRFSSNVAKGWAWLLKEQDADGNFFHEGPYPHCFYTNGQCAIALCEIYGMSKDKQFLEPAKKSIGYLLRSQSSEGGWRYSPASGSDVSVTGWVVMALQSARMAGLKVPEDHFRRVERYLDKVSPDGIRYPYQKGKQTSVTMTAEAILCRQYLGWPQDDQRMVKAIQWITEPSNLVNFEKDRNVYYWYYATQACHHIGGDAWETWNNVMRQAVPEQQVTRGREKGSWDPMRPSPDQWGGEGGRLFVTCLSIYMLEVYYRHMPLYSNPYLLLGK